MPIYALEEGWEPEIHPEAFVHPDAVLIGRVIVGPHSSIWPNAVLRADDNVIRIGARSSVQDGAVLHCTDELETIVGDDCTVGHNAHLEGCTMENVSLMGSGAIALHGAVISTGALVGANALVPGGKVVPPNAQALGVPAKIREDASSVEMVQSFADNYVARAARYQAAMRRLD